VKQFIVAIAVLWSANAMAAQCLGWTFFTTHYCSQFRTKATCGKSPQSCYWGTVNPDNQCNIWNGQEEACGNLSQCEWTSGGCSGDSAFCRGSSREQCNSSDGCSWSSGQCHLRD